MTEQSGHLRPDQELTDIFRGVVRDMAEQEHGAVKAGANSALIHFLVDHADDGVLEYHLNRSRFDSVDELKTAARKRQNQPFPDDDTE